MIESQMLFVSGSETLTSNLRGTTADGFCGAALGSYHAYTGPDDYSLLSFQANAQTITVGNEGRSLSIVGAAGMACQDGNEFYPLATATLQSVAAVKSKASKDSGELLLSHATATLGKTNTIPFGQDVKNATAVVAGWLISYETDHYLKSFQVALSDISLASGGQGVTFEPVCTMTDGSNTASGSLYVLGIGVPSGAPGGSRWVASSTWNPGDSAASFTFSDLRAPLASAVIGITSLSLSFSDGEGHKIRTMTIDAGNSRTTIQNVQNSDGSWTATVKAVPSLALADSSGHSISSSSYIDLLAIGLF